MLDIPLSPPAAAGSAATASVVLLDGRGRPAGTAPKHAVHGPTTPLHLAFSCYVVDADGRVLLTRRAGSKRTWPSTWTNACCGHPRPGETLREAVSRHLHDELGLAPRSLAVAVPDFAYRATMHDGTVEHELCPVVVAFVDGPLTPDPEEADAAEWVDWPVLVARARHAPATLSPWSVRQIAALDASIGHPSRWLAVATARRRPAPAAAPGDGCGRRGAIAPFGEMFGDRLRVVVDERLARLADLDGRAGILGETLDHLLRRSAKRLRPAFVHWGHVAAGGDGTDALDLAVGVELLHTFALVHDDVIDRSPTRRGAPSVHAGFAAGAGFGAGADDDAAAWFGSSAAIVAGDLAFVWADELVDAACARSAHGAAVRAAYTTLRTEVIVGQYLDLHLSAMPAGADACADALLVALLKSGRYTVTRPLELGARLAGADDATVAALVEFGDAAGVAFQLRDDVLGVFGDESVTGKDAFGDLREGKRTLLVGRALELVGATERDELLGHLGDPALDAAGAERCREIIASSGALASVEARIAAEAHAAAEALGAVAGPAHGALAELLAVLTERTS